MTEKDPAGGTPAPGGGDMIEELAHRRLRGPALAVSCALAVLIIVICINQLLNLHLFVGIVFVENRYLYLLATATLVACVYAYGEHFTGHYLLLTVLTFFIASQVFDEIDILVPWSSFHLTRLIRGIVVGWGIVAAILLFLGYATQLTDHFEQEIILSWFAATPVVLLVGTKIARLLVRRAVVKGVIEHSAVVVGANDLVASSRGACATIYIPA